MEATASAREVVTRSAVTYPLKCRPGPRRVDLFAWHDTLGSWRLSSLSFSITCRRSGGLLLTSSVPGMHAHRISRARRCARSCTVALGGFAVVTPVRLSWFCEDVCMQRTHCSGALWKAGSIRPYHMADGRVESRMHGTVPELGRGLMVAVPCPLSLVPCPLSPLCCVHPGRAEFTYSLSTCWP